MNIQRVCESKIVRFFHERCSYQEKVKFFREDRDLLQKKAEWQARVDFYEDIKAKAVFLRENLARASRRENPQPIEIDVDYLLLIGVKQKWVCNYTGVPLEFIRGTQIWQGKHCNPHSCTIDRIDSSKGYVPGNVQLLIWKVNSLKQDFSQLELFEISSKIVERFKTTGTYETHEY
jgi:hypothetical protein